jgi:peptidoglycan/xylan/chitin deacetylase (PgdA/CDA1 family)
MSRFITMCANRDLPVSVNLNSAIITAYPSLAAAIREMGCEIVGHGVHQRMLFMEEDEGVVIRKCLDQIEDFYGRRPRGWLGPGLAETFDTLDHLKLAGVEYVMDWVLDDFPDWLETKHGRLVSVPYGGLDLNDVTIWMGDRLSASEYTHRVRNTVATFETEMSLRPRVLTLALHPHVACVPHRMPIIIETIDWLRRREDTIFMTGGQIADWFIAESPR